MGGAGANAGDAAGADAGANANDAKAKAEAEAKVKAEAEAKAKAEAEAKAKAGEKNKEKKKYGVDPLGDFFNDGELTGTIGMKFQAQVEFEAVDILAQGVADVMRGPSDEIIVFRENLEATTKKEIRLEWAVCAEREKKAFLQYDADTRESVGPTMKDYLNMMCGNKPKTNCMFFGLICD